MELNDKTVRMTADAPKIPELEGRVCIELRNAKTGELEQRVEGKNIVTNAVKDIFAANYFGGMNYSKLMPIFREMFGGILCFQETLTEDADGYSIPNYHTAVVKAHAGQATYVPETEGIDTTRGNPNFSASAYTTHGFRHVFEFGTTQGNGTISSVALCHKDAGSYWLTNGNRSFNPYIDSDTIETSGLEPAPLFFDRSEGISYVLTFSSATTNDLLIRAHSYAGCIDGIGFTQQFPSIADSDTQNVESHYVTLPYRAADYLYLYREADKKIDAIYTNGGHKIYKSVIDLTTWSVTSTEHTDNNVTYANMYGTGGWGKLPDGHARAISLDDDGYLYLAGADRQTVYKVMYSTMIVNVEATSSVTLPNDYWGDPIQGIGHFGVNIYGGFVVDHDVIRPYTYQNQNILGYSGNEMRVIASSPDNGMVQFFPVRRSYSNGSRIGVRIAKLFLSTIKNLDTPINKNSTQTMTISYTITEVAGE